MKIILLLLITFSGYAQKLHHQMLSSQGASVVSSGRFFVRQTIGQQSITGNYKSGALIVGQGFLQSNKMKAVYTPFVSIQTLTFPNPFVNKINFQFSSAIEGPIKIVLFDQLGRLVYSAEKNPINNILTIDNLFFPEGQYFASLTANNYTYTTNLLLSK